MALTQLPATMINPQNTASAPVVLDSTGALPTLPGMNVFNIDIVDDAYGKKSTYMQHVYLSTVAV